MPKFKLTIECDSIDELQRLSGWLWAGEVHDYEQKWLAAGQPVLGTEPVAIATTDEPIATHATHATHSETPAPEPETPEGTPPASPPAAAPAAASAPTKRGRPPKKPTLAEQLMASAEASKATLNGDLPPLDKLILTITNAVREGRKTGNKKVEGMLPALRQKIGLDYIADAKDDHRSALYAFTQEAGLTIA